MISTVDPEAGHIHKTTHRQTDGFKGHLALEPETGLFTAVALHPAGGADHTEGTVALDLPTDETAPLQVFGDTAYSGHQCRAALSAAGHEVFCRPAPLKAAVPGGFTLDDFRIDTTADTVTCPAGHTAGLGPPGGQQLQRIAFFGKACAACALRAGCTKGKFGRTVTIRPHHDQQAAARHRPQPAGAPPALATTRRTRRRLARGPRQPAPSLPGNPHKRHLAPPPGRRPQPPPTDQPRTHPHHRDLDHRPHHPVTAATDPHPGKNVSPRQHLQQTSRRLISWRTRHRGCPSSSPGPAWSSVSLLHCSM